MIAFLSDIHGNLPALEAALKDARARGASRIFCAGDLTGYGPFPKQVCWKIQEEKIPAILGNYDRKVLEVLAEGKSAAAGMKPKKREILLWAANRLGGRSGRFLGRLPERLSFRLDEGTRILIVHGSPLSDDDPIYPSITARGLAVKLGGASPDLLICGHTHIPFARRVEGILVVNCGSAGQPVDGDPRPAYALVRTEPGVAPRASIVRFEYDRDRILRELAQTDLPKALGRDFALGTKMRFLA